MKQKFPALILAVSLIVTACSSSANANTATPEIIPTVIADHTLMAEGRLEPIRYAEIAFNTSGVVNEVLVKEGERVQKGDLLIRLGDESDTNYAAAQLELVTAQQALNDLLNTSEHELAQTIIDLKEAKEDYDKAVNYLHYLQNDQRVPQTDTRLILIQTWKGYQYQYKSKNFKGPAPQDWIIEAENDLALKKAELDELQRAYDRMKNGTDTDQLAVLEARLDAAGARVAAFSVTAPFDSVVADLDATAGGSIHAGEIAVTVADFSKWVVKTTDLTELDVVNLADNQPAIITLDAFPDVELRGNVISIGQRYTEVQGDVVYEVTILLSEIHPDMRWGMTASVTFIDED
ncbi:MAG TPA: HlyD family efflux transporter periplasmic adaptor subunit [Anaerolineales bacterium]|nr:HlyD family efflux transporter periplasmic adaptor subunit [Anaerolineales bacterium]